MGLLQSGAAGPAAERSIQSCALCPSITSTACQKWCTAPPAQYKRQPDSGRKEILLHQTPFLNRVSECLWCFTSGLCPNRNDIFLSSLLLRDIKSVECRSTETLTLFLSYASSECSQFWLPPGRAAFLVWLLLRVDYEERRFSREGFSFLHFPPCCSVFMFNWRTVLSTLCVLPFSPLLPLMTRFIHWCTANIKLELMGDGFGPEL